MSVEEAAEKARLEAEKADSSSKKEDEKEKEENEEEKGTSEGEKEKSGTDGTEDEEQDDEQFMDPNKVPPQLKDAFKKMQASFTRSKQRLATESDKVELYDKLMGSNPVEAIKVLAARAGLKISAEGEVTKDKENPVEETETVKFIRNLIKKELEPFAKEFQEESLKARADRNVAYLDEHHPDWSLYEDEMIILLKTHPTLVSDPRRLYRLAKMEATSGEKRKNGAEKTTQVITKGSTGRDIETKPVKAKTIEEAFEAAKRAVKV